MYKPGFCKFTLTAGAACCILLSIFTTDGFASIHETHSPRIEFESLHHDFGPQVAGSLLKHTFVFRNIGSETLLIQSVKAG